MNRKRIERKVWGRPRLPLAVDAAYDNKWGGNLIAYAYDPNPARSDPVYLKLKEGFCGPLTLTTREHPEEHVALYYMDAIQARQMDESTYNHLLRMPVHVLEKEFSISYSTNASLRKKIEDNYEYAFGIERNEWTDC